MKNAWKKTLSLLLCLVLLAGLFPAALAEGPIYTVYFRGEGEYVEPISGESGSQITLPRAKREHHAFLGWALENGGKAVYQAGDSLVLTEELFLYSTWREGRDYNLTATVAGTGENNTQLSVPLGGSVTMRVSASVDEGELYYEWFCYGREDPRLQPEKEDPSCCILDNVDRYCQVACKVSDDEGYQAEVYFYVSPQTGLKAWSARTGTDYDERSVAFGESVTLQVEASVDAGQLHYQWLKENENAEFITIQGENTASYTLSNADKNAHFLCRVNDDYYNSQVVSFDVYIESGLKVWIPGTNELMKEITVKKGESVELSVGASVNSGGIRYQWTCESLDASLLPTDPNASSFTIPAVNRHLSVICTVWDDYGSGREVGFEIYTESTLKACVAGTENVYWKYKINFAPDK